LNIGFSQNNPERRANELDERYEPNSSSTFNLSKENKNSSFNKVDEAPANFIKFSPSFLFRRKVMFFYNRSLGDKFVIDAGLGKAFGSDLIQNAALSAFGTIDFTDQTITADMFLDNEHYVSSTPFVSFGFRLYFEDGRFDGNYLLTNYRFEKQTYKIDEIVNGFPVQDPDKNVDLLMNAFTFGYGLSWLSGNKKNILSEFEVSFGLKFFKYTKYALVETINTWGTVDYAYMKSQNQMISKMVPNINLSYYLGFGF